MGIQQRNLTIAFREIQPETLYASIHANKVWRHIPLSAQHIDQDTFQGLAHAQYPSYSYEEIQNIHSLLTEGMASVSGTSAEFPSVFYLLVNFGKRVFRQKGGDLVCDFSEVLAWQNTYQGLGQDIFTTAYLAYEDARLGRPSRSEFAWGAIIKTNSNQLNALLREGIAENHCHLGGTTQNFPLSWACLMNYTEAIKRAADQIGQNLQPHLSRGTSGNVWSWKDRLFWAAHLRAELFKILEGGFPAENTLDMYARYFHPEQEVSRQIHALRYCYGVSVPQKNGSCFVLDYALRSRDCKSGLLQNHNRILSGERSFLYRCFRACFDGTFSSAVQTWFYLYLLLKENFRAEIVQVNRQAGFRNFKDYQDRKDSIYDVFPAYRAEALRLSISANQQQQNILSFEVRIAPKATPSKLYQQVRNNDADIAYANSNRTDFRHFYVYHFIKSPDSGKHLDRPRNFEFRLNYRKQAIALAHGLCHSPTLSSRVFGIDAANIEIGCRPETFATEFRYLRKLSPRQTGSNFYGSPILPHLQSSYHVGEDFLDIADGLRAIDEAVKFLHLERGDRLGHALALGVSPEVHYNFKGRRVVLPKQDFLDNIVWLLYRAPELNVEINAQLRSRLQVKANQLFSEIYGEYAQQIHVTLYDYYCSMQLRGDAPDLYRTLPYQKPRPFAEDAYDAYKEDPSDNLPVYRKSTAITGLCQRYHYGPEERRLGNVVEAFTVRSDYIHLVEEMQDKLARELEQAGIMIECNPTSNYLIGTFRRYDIHPIFRFNTAGLAEGGAPAAASPQLSVSINTDDMGVFDTSLENEYAILAACLFRVSQADGSRKYTEDSIFRYLDHIRKSGLQQSFTHRQSLSHLPNAEIFP